MFSLYIRYVRPLHYKKTAAKVILLGCKGAKIGKKDKSTQQPRFNLSYCKVEIAIHVKI